MEKLTLQPRITGLLRRLFEKRSLLVVTLQDGHKEYNSAIIELNEANNYFLLDELNPEAGHPLIEQQRRCHIKAHIDGVSLNFDAMLEEIGADNDIPFYKIPIPTEINYLQRRSAHRVQFSAANPIPASLTTHDGTQLKGTLADLSIGGLRVKFDIDITTPIAIGDTLQCKVNLDDTHLNAEVIVRLVRTESQHNTPAFIGCQFINLIKTQERQLQRLIMDIERAARKKQQ